MKKIKLNMLTVAATVKGQGVASATDELINLLKNKGTNSFSVKINGGLHRCDILHAHTIDPVSFLKLKLFRGPKVVHVHFLPSTLKDSLRIPRLISRMLDRYIISFYQQADRLIVVNPSVIPEMVSLGLEKDRIRYIPNFVAADRFYVLSDEKRRKIREGLGLDPNDFAVLGAGQIQTRKGVADFISVAEKLPQFRFIWAGGFSFGRMTDGYDELKKATENPPPNVLFTGIVGRDEMNGLYNAADVYFSPSYNELFPMTILEAANVQLPVVLRDLEVYRSVLDENYCAVSDIDGMCTALTALKTDPGFYAESRERSAKTAQYYSEDSVLAMWTGLYEGLLRKE